MKVQIFYWASHDHSELTGYKHKEIVETNNPMGIVNGIYNTGLNVMIVHCSKESEVDMSIRVDGRQFQAR